jgi:hypothetical protein
MRLGPDSAVAVGIGKCLEGAFSSVKIRLSAVLTSPESRTGPHRLVHQ